MSDAKSSSSKPSARPIGRRDGGLSTIHPADLLADRPEGA